MPDSTSEKYKKQRKHNEILKSTKKCFRGFQVVFMKPAADAYVLTKYDELPMEKRCREFVDDLQDLAKEIYKRTLAFNNQRTALNCGGSAAAFAEVLKRLIEEVA